MVSLVYLFQTTLQNLLKLFSKIFKLTNYGEKNLEFSKNPLNINNETSSNHITASIAYTVYCILWEDTGIRQRLHSKVKQNKLGLSWAKLSRRWGLKLKFD